MSSSDTSSAPSSSPPASPEASFHGPPSTERLVGHFVAAKRSLTITSHVWRANELTSSSRALIEEIAVLNAKNAFARRGVDEQVETLRVIRAGIADVEERAAADFKATIGRLDEANDRLQGTLQSLRETVVDASLQGTPANADCEADASDTSPGDPKKPKTLYSYVDEDSHTSVLHTLHALIDSFNEARADLDEDIRGFEDSLRFITETLQDGSVSASSSGPSDKRTLYDGPAPSIPDLFHGLEGHAAEMATLLQSLVSHYDLCVTALKHTEGGGQAAKVAAQAEELKSTPGAEESLYRKTVPEPISEDERAQMLSVLENDALEVEDVTAELRHCAADMEAQYSALVKHADSARVGNKTLQAVLGHMHQVSAALPRHLEASKAFRVAAHSIQGEIQAKTQELVELAEFHETFLVSYSKVTDEVERRRKVEAQMNNVASRAQRELDKLHEADNEARDAFLQDVGEHLPRDLWLTVGQRVPRWQVSVADVWKK